MKAALAMNASILEHVRSEVDVGLKTMGEGGR